MESKSEIYPYRDNVQEFGKSLGLQNSRPQIVFNPGVGGDLHNLLLLTSDTTSIFMTDIVPLDPDSLMAIATHPPNLPIQLKGISQQARLHPMHEYFAHRIHVLGYTITSCDKQDDGVVHISIERGGIQRELYYQQTDHTSQEKNQKIIHSLNKRRMPETKLIYLQKALEPSVPATVRQK
jgi:hypothetical protein